MREFGDGGRGNGGDGDDADESECVGNRHGERLNARQHGDIEQRQCDGRPGDDIFGATEQSVCGGGGWAGVRERDGMLADQRLRGAGVYSDDGKRLGWIFLHK